MSCRLQVALRGWAQAVGCIWEDDLGYDRLRIPIDNEIRDVLGGLTLRQCPSHNDLVSAANSEKAGISGDAQGRYRRSNTLMLERYYRFTGSI